MKIIINVLKVLQNTVKVLGVWLLKGLYNTINVGWDFEALLAKIKALKGLQNISKVLNILLIQMKEKKACKS